MSSIKRGIGGFHVVVVQWTLKKCTKKAWCTCRAVVLLMKPIVFLTLLLSSSLVKVPTEQRRTRTRRKHKATTFFFFSWTLIQSLEFNSRRICYQHLTNWTSWNKGDNLWSSANSLCKWRFRNVFVTVAVIVALGTWRSDNGHVHENVPEKQTSHHFKIFRDYRNLPCYLKEEDFDWRWRGGNALKFGQIW